MFAQVYTRWKLRFWHNAHELFLIIQPAIPMLFAPTVLISHQTLLTKVGISRVWPMADVKRGGANWLSMTGDHAFQSDRAGMSRVESLTRYMLFVYINLGVKAKKQPRPPHCLHRSNLRHLRSPLVIG